MLLANPEAGAVISGTGGLRKVRFAPPSWHSGKRGASRVIYAHIETGNVIYFFTIYGKNEQASLSAAEKKVFRKVLERLQARYKS